MRLQSGSLCPVVSHGPSGAPRVASVESGTGIRVFFITGWLCPLVGCAAYLKLHGLWHRQAGGLRLRLQREQGTLWSLISML